MNMVPANRRLFMKNCFAFGGTVLLSPAAFADELFRTPRQTEGPFYPDKLPLDTDNDLIIINKNLTPAIGEITHLTGRVLDTAGKPIKDATVEIWQCDANQVYLHTSDSGPKSKQQDKNFQGFGTFTTASAGEYRFRTIKPVPYPGRPAPHIHVKVKKGGRDILTTQFMVAGHAGNARDHVFNELRDPINRELVLVDFKPLKDSKIGELTAKFDIVIGRTPDDRDLPSKKNS
ncbi:dioxygenase family protein [Zavarzinella formosa]|uniref:dioxygenase family protein n=1 Tax=Zavarzinella formosa TaxID=360055 RepID=UPI0002D9269C|nr:protocatechuate 3,4-dioxygenase [Zavarzinella formosa]